MESTHVRWNGARCPYMRQASSQCGIDAHVIEDLRCTGECKYRASLPEGASSDRRPASAIGRPFPVEDEVQPAPVGLLHREDEIHQPLAPAQRPGQSGRVPQIAVELECTRGVVDTGNTLVAGFLRVNQLVQPI